MYTDVTLQNFNSFFFYYLLLQDMDYYKPDKEWEVKTIHQECMNIVYSSSNSSMHCILQYEINVARFSSMYYSSIIIPAVGMINHCSLNVL